MKLRRIIGLYLKGHDITFDITQTTETSLPIPKARLVIIDLRVIMVEIRENCWIAF